ncbi:MAG: substrate-binding domain-containing protein [Acidobacteria bacterium]|nr:substrate-binding domain-containing protein [Acidobacteriota bacterium]
MSSFHDSRWKLGSESIFLIGAVVLLFVIAGCRRKSDVDRETTITLYGFSVVKEPLETEIFPAFKKEWFEKTGQTLTFTPSYAGSELVTNQILSGVEADVAILAIERNADSLVKGGVTRHKWREMPYGGIVNKTPMVILVRQGNPKGIHDFKDLGKPGVKLLLSDPIFSGAGQWSLLAIYGSELIKSEKESGVRDEKQAFETLKRVWRSVIATPGSAREARTHFEQGEGDALVTYELEALQLIAKKLGHEMVVPPTTIFSEHPVIIIDYHMPAAKYAIVELFIRYLWEKPAQQAWVNSGFRSVSDERLNDKFPKIKNPFYVKDLGGWSQAYPQIIDGVWKQKIQPVGN